MKMLVLTIICCVYAIQNASADAVSDLQIIDGAACETAGSGQNLIKNMNAAKRIIATIKISSNVPSYKYMAADGAERVFSYPYLKEVRRFCRKVAFSRVLASVSH